MKDSTLNNLVHSPLFIIMGIVFILAGWQGALISSLAPILGFAIGSSFILIGSRMSLQVAIILCFIWGAAIWHYYGETSRLFSVNRDSYLFSVYIWWGAFFALFVSAATGIAGYLIRRYYGSPENLYIALGRGSSRKADRNSPLRMQNTAPQDVASGTNKNAQTTIEDKLKSLAEMHDKGLSDGDKV